MEFQNGIEKDRLNNDRINLRELNKRLHEREIEMAENKRLDEMQLKFLNENSEISFEDILVVKEVFDFLKKQN